MYRSFATFSAAFLVAAAIATGGAGATELKIGGYIGESFAPTRCGYTGTLRTGPGRYTVRDAETGQLIRSGRTGRPGGKYSKTELNTGTAHVLPGRYKVEVWIGGPCGKVYKGEMVITATSFMSSQSVVIPVHEQTKSEKELDKARAAKDKRDALRTVHRRTLDTAGHTENPITFRLLVAAAAQYFNRIEELNDEYLAHLDNARRLAKQEKAENEKAEKQKAANQQNARNDTMRNAQRGAASAPRNYAAMPPMPRMPQTPRMSVPRVESPRVLIRRVPSGRR